MAGNLFERRSGAGCRRALIAAAWLLYAFAASAQPLGGPAFSDPGRTVEMSAEWIAAPIRNDEVPAGVDLIVTLDQHLYPALLPLISDYGNRHGLKIAVQEGTCGISSGALGEKAAHIGGFCCPAGDVDRLPGLRFHTLAIASLALIVHPDNPAESLTIDRARALFRGTEPRWSRGGGEPFEEGVLPLGRLHCKNRPGHWRLLLADEDEFSPRLHEVSTIPDMIGGVSVRREAVGYETLWMVRKHFSRSVKTVRLDGVDPGDDEALVAGRYPLYRVYNITTWAEGAAHDERADRLVAYIKENFQRVEAKYGFVPAARLREAGWRFVGDELVGEPAR